MNDCEQKPMLMIVSKEAWSDRQCMVVNYKPQFYSVLRLSLTKLFSGSQTKYFLNCRGNEDEQMKINIMVFKDYDEYQYFQCCRITLLHYVYLCAECLTP